MNKKGLIPLLLLENSDRGRIDGRTRFQKLVFLAQEEPTAPLEDDYQYEYFSHKYGPFSKELAEILDEAEDEGLVEVDEVRTPNGKKYVYEITEAGKAALDDQRSELLDRFEELVSRSFGEKVLDEIVDIEDTFNNMPVSNLLEYVYNHYPEYTHKSELDIS